MICFEWPAGLLVAPFSDDLFLKTTTNGLEVLLANSLNMVLRISSGPTGLKVSEDFLPLVPGFLPGPLPLCHTSWLCLQSTHSWLEG